MNDAPGPATATSARPAGERRCPACGASLSEPVRGDLHCYVYCLRCGTEYPLDDPSLTSSQV